MALASQYLASQRWSFPPPSSLPSLPHHPSMPSLPSAQSLNMSLESINAHFAKEDQKHFPRNWDAELVLRHRNPGQHNESQRCNDQANKLRALFRKRAADKTASFTVGKSPQSRLLWTCGRAR